VTTTPFLPHPAPETMGLFSKGGGGGGGRPVPPPTAAAAPAAADDGAADAAAQNPAPAAPPLPASRSLSLPPRRPNPSQHPRPSAPLVDVEGGSGGGANGSGNGKAISPSPFSATTTTTPAADQAGAAGPPRRNRLHRRSAESPLVGGFFHPLRPLGPSHLAEARAHAFAARARDPDRAAEGAALDPLLRGMSGEYGEDEHVDAHHAQTRLSRRAEDMMMQRLEDLEHDALAHKPVPEDVAEGPKRPWHAALRNLPVLLVMIGMLVVVLLGKSRLHVPEPLAQVHGVTSAEPYFLPLGKQSVDYLFVLATAAPWYGFVPPGEATTSTKAGGGYRRRRLLGAAAGAADGEVAATGLALQRAWEAVEYDPKLAGADGAWRKAALAAVRAGQRAGHAERRVARRQGALAQALSRRRRLAAAAPSSSSSSAEPLPRLVLQLVERLDKPPPDAAAAPAAAAGAKNGSAPPTLSASSLPTLVLTPERYGFAPVAGQAPQYCSLKQGAANRCTLSFTNATTGAGAKPNTPLYLALSLDAPGAIAVELHARELPKWLGVGKIWIALVVLIVMLVGIATEKVHRMWCAMIASFAMLALLLWLDMAPDLTTVITWMDASTLGLLFGMMLIIGKLAQTGAFEVVTATTLRVAKGNMGVLTVAMLTVTAFVSAFLDNVTTILLVGPMTISLVHSMGQDPRPLFIAQILASNIGGAATLV
jgi:hypothetical protein